MEYQEFKAIIKEYIKEYLPIKYQNAEIDIRQVRKNNNVWKDGMSIRMPGSNIGPTIYLNDFFETYRRNKNLEEVLQSIASAFVENEVYKSVSAEALLNFKNAKDKVIFQVVGVKNNEEMLETVPHRTINDMAVIYRVLIEITEDGVGSILIDDNIMKMMNMNEERLYSLAVENTQREFPSTFQSMETVMADIIKNDLQGDFEDIPEELVDMMKDMGITEVEESMEEKPHMYVLTNTHKTNGASVLFYPEIQKEIADKVQGEYFVLPSSIHEVLIVPDVESWDYHVLKEMVRDVNGTQVAPDEVLTNQVYAYDKELGKVILAEEWENRRQKKAEKGHTIADWLKEKKDKIGKNADLGKRLIPEPSL